MNKAAMIFMVAIVSLTMTSCGEFAIVQKSFDYDYKYESAKAYYMAGKYTKASALLYDLLSIMKGTGNGEESLYMTAMSEYRKKNYDMAHSSFSKYTQVYPRGAYVELAHYYSAMSLYNQVADPRLDQSSTMEAMTEFQQFLDRYPYTKLKAQTQEIVLALQDRLVEKECLSAKLYYDLGGYIINSMYGGSNYEACIVTAQNALRDYPYATQEKRELLSILILRSRYQLAAKSVEDKRLERYRNTIDEYYAFVNDFPESKYMKEAQGIFRQSEKAVKKRGLGDDEE